MKYDSYAEYIYAQQDAEVLERIADIEEASVEACRDLLVRVKAYLDGVEIPYIDRLTPGLPIRPSSGDDDYIGRIQDYILDADYWATVWSRDVEEMRSAMGATA